MTDPDRYSIIVRKLHVDGEDLWRATVRELPDVAEFAATREEAVALARDAIEDLQETAAEDGTPFPEPVDEGDDYSGRVTLRMSKSMHRDVAERAEREEVSLNAYIVECIALRFGSLQAVQTSTAWVRSTHEPAPALAYDKYLRYAESMVMSIYGDVEVGSLGSSGQYAISTAAPTFGSHWRGKQPTAAPHVPHFLLEKRRTG